MTLRPLPPQAQRLCDKLNVTQRLLVHLQIVHDTAADLVEGLKSAFPNLPFDGDAVFFGAATHDLGKVLHPGEITGPGHRHEDDGPGLLIQCGVSESLARFAKTHARWGDNIEDMIVALADAVWKGKRVERLENALLTAIVVGTGFAEWEVVVRLDEIIEPIAAGADQRLIQHSLPV
jgi:hypothetical protein